MHDAATIALAREGDRDSFRRLYEEHRERVYRTAYRYCRSPQDAEDVMQETFIKAFKRLDTYDLRASTSFSSWLLSICINASIDMQHTLPSASPEEIEQEADTLYEAFHAPDGGFYCTVVRWHRPEYPQDKVLASVRGFNKYRT